MRVLVVGATRALRPAVETLAAQGDSVWALARTVVGTGLPAVPVEVDYTDQPALEHALTGLSFDAALLYCPTAAAAALELFASSTTGAVVLLMTSALAAPPFELDRLPPSRYTRLVLGWSGVGAEARWHRPEELSAAAVAGLRSGADAVLGAIRPWDDRPV